MDVVDAIFDVFTYNTKSRKYSLPIDNAKKKKIVIIARKRIKKKEKKTAYTCTTIATLSLAYACVTDMPASTKKASSHFSLTRSLLFLFFSSSLPSLSRTYSWSRSTSFHPRVHESMKRSRIRGPKVGANDEVLPSFGFCGGHSTQSSDTP